MGLYIFLIAFSKKSPETNLCGPSWLLEPLSQPKKSRKNFPPTCTVADCIGKKTYCTVSCAVLALAFTCSAYVVMLEGSSMYSVIAAKKKVFAEKYRRKGEGPTNLYPSLSCIKEAFVVWWHDKNSLGIFLSAWSARDQS